MVNNTKPTRRQQLERRESSSRIRLTKEAVRHGDVGVERLGVGYIADCQQIQLC